MRAIVTSLIAFAALALAGPIKAADEFDIEGLYRTISPQPTADPKKVEVLEIFWYRCPHCNKFKPYFDKYASTRPDYVAVRRMPAVLRDGWIPQAKIFYVAEALGELERLHSSVFDAIHNEDRPMSSRADIKAFFVENGVKAADFDAAFDSFSLDAQVRQANAYTRHYGITGVPAVIINGRYRTSGSLAGSFETVMTVIDVLVEKERKRMGL